MSRRGIPIVVAAPSGTGKTTVCRMLVDDDPLLEFSVSHTTRERRTGEREIGCQLTYGEKAGSCVLCAGVDRCAHAECSREKGHGGDSAHGGSSVVMVLRKVGRTVGGDGSSRQG